MGYRTVAWEASASFIEKKSEFIGHIAPVKTVEQAEEFIAKISKKHFNASHNVYAYILREGQIKRFSDNGEPQGTAGIPALDVLQKEGLTDVCVVITRYFGGILLGGGGLVRAYSHAVTVAVAAAQVMQMELCKALSVKCDYSFYGKLTHILPDYNIKVLSSSFLEEVELSLLINADRLEKFTKALTELSNGKLIPNVTADLWEELS